MSRPPCALAPLQQPKTSSPPDSLGPPLHLGTEIVWGDGGWGAGRDGAAAVFETDSGQHFICNHLNVFAVFRIQSPWGCLGGGLRRASLYPVDCTVGGGCAGGSCWQVCNNQPIFVAWVLTQRGYYLGACALGSLGVMAHPWSVPSD